ncbi:hypothetical protein M9H77_19659 [Catharanthus roseus]|uniref:Uncharacterized protein n=1 Tax=Catharanthus roseus TaxID=4058 RepID=A0ACC0BAZ5_CATRO|nr:hypothetical protein M9H77_19659 [Catharanthus roseus]
MSSSHRGVHAQPFRQWRQQFPPNYLRDRPPEPSRDDYSREQQPRQGVRRYNFVIQLCLSRPTQRKSETEALIAKLEIKPENSHVFVKGYVAGTLFYQQWVEALETMVQLWEIRLNDGHLFTPRLIQNVEVSSDKDELRDRLKSLFLAKLNGFLDGELVQKWHKKLLVVLDEIKETFEILSKPKKLNIYYELTKKRDGLVKERDLIMKRIEEFKNGVRCFVDYLEGKGEDEQEEGIGVNLGVYKFGREFNWEKIHWMMMRECRRFDEGLPIFAFRRDILERIHYQQISVLIGETGSGKSTQLVQFLADSGLASDGSVICTQPRKLAAISLTKRVKEESRGCYGDNSVVCYPSYSSSQKFDSKVIFMTDHCLLQHYMRDRDLSRISCIIVDEAHERSLNTDLLLAMIKNLLSHRLDLRLVIMSATADANQLAAYFFGCGTFHVAGRNFPVDIRYVPCESDDNSGSGMIASYVSDVVRMASDIHKSEVDGTILAFLTSQMEVEWACENFRAHSAIALPLHGKLSYEEQDRVFQNYSGKRKVIFSTNIAETSLTIPGVKYVIDSGLVKDSRYEPSNGMNVLKVSWISQSSASQRAGRAGRTEPGRCYRLYSQSDFELMPRHQEPEIRRVHLGVAVLRILALGVKNVLDFDFVDAPSAKAIEMALRNLVHLGAVTSKEDLYELTPEGRKLVKLGIEPRLGKIILQSFDFHLGKEGLVLAAVMANSSSIFCRVGTDESKFKADRLKIQFCHQGGDLFTLLAVFKEWESVPDAIKNNWCWEKSINAKSMRRCLETMQELETCLRNELNTIVPSYWCWTPHMCTEHDGNLKNIILSAFAENVAMYSGYDQLGYEVALTGKHVQLHPSCSLLVFDHRPRWVVFGEILSTSNQYLLCVTGFDFTSLSALYPPPMFDFHKMDRLKLETKVLTGFGSVLLKRFCGKSCSSLHNLVSRIRAECLDERIFVEVKVDQNKVLLYASSADMEKVCSFVNDALEYERKLLCNECMEKCLYNGGPTFSPSIALFGAGAEIKHLELDKRCLTVDVFHSRLNCVNDKELLMFLERDIFGTICAVQKFTAIGQDGQDKEKWGRVTFLTPDAAKRATELNQVDIFDGMLKLVPSRNIGGGDQKMFTFPALRAKVSWLRRCSNGKAIVICNPNDVACMLDDFSGLLFNGNYVRIEASLKYPDRIVISGLDKEISEDELREVLNGVTNRRIQDCFLVRGHALEKPSVSSCEEALLRETSSFMPKRNPLSNCVRVQVFQPEPKDTYMRASILFDGSLYLEAAQALEQMNGRVLPGCLPWQKMKCQQLFHSSVSCPAAVYLIELAKQRIVKSLLMLHESKQLEVRLRGGSLPPDLMKRVVQKFGPDLHGLKEKIPEAEFTLNTKRHCISVCGTKELKQRIEDIIHEVVQTSGLQDQSANSEASCPICLCEVEDGYRLEGCGHEFCRSCLLEQCESAIKSQDSFPVRCTYGSCGASLLITDLRSLLSCDKLEELFRASLGAFVAASGGSYRFCPSPDCPSIYRVADSGTSGPPFICGACFVETCTRCHVEYHPYLSCEKYLQFKNDPDSSLNEWCLGKDNVKKCPFCSCTIEKGDGCNHIPCRCGKHVCWACLEFFDSSDDCYNHMRVIHQAII